MTRPFHFVNKEFYDLIFSAQALCFILKHFEWDEKRFRAAIMLHVEEVERCIATALGEESVGTGRT